MRGQAGVVAAAATAQRATVSLRTLAGVASVAMTSYATLLLRDGPSGRRGDPPPSMTLADLQVPGALRNSAQADPTLLGAGVAQAPPKTRRETADRATTRRSPGGRAAGSGVGAGFQVDVTADGRQLRSCNVVDEFTSGSTGHSGGTLVHH